MASSVCACWNTARTSITESISAPAGVYRFDGRFGTLAQEVAQRAKRGVGGRGIASAGKDKNPEAPVRLGDVAKMNRLGIREPNDRRGVKARADHEALGEMLVIGSAVRRDGR